MPLFAPTILGRLGALKPGRDLKYPGLFVAAGVLEGRELECPLGYCGVDQRVDRPQCSISLHKLYLGFGSFSFSSYSSGSLERKSYIRKRATKHGKK